MSRSEDAADAGPAIVTGGSRGIGAATVEVLAGSGRPVVFSYATDDAAAQAVEERVAAAGGRAIACRGDTADEGAVERLFATCEAHFGPPAGVFANAGVTGPACRLEDLEAADLRRVLEINVAGTFLVARAAVRSMAASGGGTIVLMSSRAARIGGADEWIHYAASKGAIDTLCVGLAREAGPKGIRVNAVAPGLIDTEIHSRAGLGDRLSAAAGAVPLGRAGKAVDVARAVRWLMSSESGYVSGAILDVGGGR